MASLPLTFPETIIDNEINALGKQISMGRQSQMAQKQAKLKGEMKPIMEIVRSKEDLFWNSFFYFELMQLSTDFLLGGIEEFRVLKTQQSQTQTQQNSLTPSKSKSKSQSQNWFANTDDSKIDEIATPRLDDVIDQPLSQDTTIPDTVTSYNYKYFMFFFVCLFVFLFFF